MAYEGKRLENDRVVLIEDIRGLQPRQVQAIRSDLLDKADQRVLVYLGYAPGHETNLTSSLSVKEALKEIIDGKVNLEICLNGLQRKKFDRKEITQDVFRRGN